MASQQVVATPVAVASADKKICRYDVATGSVTPKRVCKTAAQWNAEQGGSTAALGELQQQQQTQRSVSGNRP